ncbi:MAG: branched-chain amino acid transaminase [Coriobacteriia bacterium]|nr:branched-chain amino acid transaminase [Coriobacteriia bacterium]
MAALPKVDKIWMDGALVDWDKAQVHVLTHALHYGSGVFEGIRCYETPDGPAVFRLTEHMERLVRSAKMMRMASPYTVEQLVTATLELIAVNGLKECYIRPVIMRGYGVMGLDPLPAPIEAFIAVWPWGSYLGEDALKNGVDAGISSWRQRSINATPPQIKATGNYINSSFARMEANDHGYAEAILLNETGYVCEGTGENIFVVRDEIIVTPPVSDGILDGLTRDTIISLAQDMEMDIVEDHLTRTDLYIADEIFFTGTAAEVVPIKSVDHREIGAPGPMTKALQEAYFKVVRGQDKEYDYWLERV